MTDKVTCSPAEKPSKENKTSMYTRGMYDGDDDEFYSSLAA